MGVRTWVGAVAPALVLWPVVALAGDGLLEINQACAEQRGPTAGDEPGCFSGDTDGFPVTIDGSAGNSFVLTGNLQVPDENTTAISVTARDIAVDLAGFEIRGITRCTNSGRVVVCSPTGTGDGVSIVDSLSQDGVRVFNGTVVGMGSAGVSVGDRGMVDRVRSTQNGGVGITGLEGSMLRRNVADLNGNNGISSVEATVEGNTSHLNGSSGIFCARGCSVSGNVTNGNTGSGIACSAGCAISQNTSSKNGASGIVAITGSTLSGNTTHENGGDGINADASLIQGNTAHLNGNDGIEGGDGSTIINNTSYDNGDDEDPTLDDGIECNRGCVVRGNSARSNSGFGLTLGQDSAYRENVVTDNGAGTVTGMGSGNDLGANYCAGTGVGLVTCP